MYLVCRRVARPEPAAGDSADGSQVQDEVHGRFFARRPGEAALRAPRFALLRKAPPSGVAFLRKSPYDGFADLPKRLLGRAVRDTGAV